MSFLPQVFLFLFCALNLISTNAQRNTLENGRRRITVRNSDSPYSHRVTLDPRGRYILEWLVDFPMERIFFNVTVATNGYVGFGLSKKGKMAGADIIIGGVSKNGEPYFTDRHGVEGEAPILDENQDWNFHEAWERGTLTFLSFSRAFDTCDTKGDIPITNNLLTIIWAYGERDDEQEFHYQNRGTFNVYLLDPDLTPQSLNDPNRQPSNPNISSSSLFRITEERMLPAVETSYWCSFHRVPTSQKNHIIGFNTVFPSDRDRQLIHHYILHRCRGTEGTPQFQLLEQASANGGGECYQQTMVGPPVASPCQEIIHGWGVGGRTIFFPDHVGIPMSENGTEFFMLQVHYDNPNLLPNTTATVMVDAYYTSTLRENDLSVLSFGTNVPAPVSLLIPPSSLNHTIFGQCAPSCTNSMLPREGINVVAAMLHTHTTGKEATLHQYRDGRELPWILSDDNYNFDFQQVRVLRKERKIYPGDHMIQRCVYDTTTRNGTVITGGFSTRKEMCLGFVYYYRRIPGIVFCTSEILQESYRTFIGIRNTTFDAARRDVVITDPSEYAGLTVSEYATNNIDWDLGLREELQRQHKYEVQTSICPNTLATGAGNGGGTSNDISSSPAASRRRSNIIRWKRSFYSDDSLLKESEIEKPLRRYSADGTGYVRNTPIVLRVAGRRVGSNLNENEVVFPKDIPPYSPPRQCKIESLLSKQFNFLY
ncbi:unnamed protein product [Orchesella dallaii]|uniref:DOMON domain-containing protein n=1 Tax=Orchesella dallaii TaxID=48710 RepID=A0ABP1PHR7_9HEXA